MAAPSAADQQLASRINLFLADDGASVRWTDEGWDFVGACGSVVPDTDLAALLALILGVNPSALGAEVQS